MLSHSTNSKLFIFFVTFIIFQRTFSTFLEIKYPNHENIDSKDNYGLTMNNIRTLLNTTSIIFIIYILCNYDIHTFLQIIFIILMLNNIRYFLFDLKLIYLLIEKNNKNNGFVEYMDLNGNKISSMILANVTLFLLIILLA